MSYSTWIIIHLFPKVGFMDIYLCFIAYYYWLKTTGNSIISISSAMSSANAAITAMITST